MSSLSIVHAVRSDGFAGVERHMAALAAQQVRDGHRVALIGGDPDRMRDVLHGVGVPHTPARTTIEVARALGTFRGTDVLHLHMTAAEAASLLAVGQWGVPVVATRHFAGPRGSSVAARAAAVLIRRRVAAQISISQYVADRIDGPSTVVHAGVPMAEYVPSVERTRTVLVAQRLEPEKKTDMAIRAFATSGVADDGWRLQIAGSGAQRELLGQLAGELGVAASVDFLGMRHDMDALLALAGLLIAPCEIEGLGLTVLEAMACGLPVVAAGAGGHLETAGLVEGAALYAPGDPEAAGALLAQWASDPTRRDRYGRDLFDTQRERFTVPAQARGTEAVYRGLS